MEAAMRGNSSDDRMDSLDLPSPVIPLIDSSPPHHGMSHLTPTTLLASLLLSDVPISLSFIRLPPTNLLFTSTTQCQHLHDLFLLLFHIVFHHHLSTHVHRSQCLSMQCHNITRHRNLVGHPLQCNICMLLCHPLTCRR